MRHCPIVALAAVLSLSWALSPQRAVGQLDSDPARPAAGQARSLDQQLFSATTIAVMKLNPAQLDVPSWLLGDSQQDRSDSLARISGAIEDELKWLEAVAGQESVYLAVDVPFTSAQPPLRLIYKNRDASTRQQVAERLGRFLADEPVVRGDYVVASPTHSMADRSYSIKPEILSPDRPHLEAAARQVESYPIQFWVAPPDYLRRMFEELLPQLPSELGGGPTTVITRGVQSAAIGWDPVEGRFEVTVSSDSAADAQALAERLPELAKQLVALSLQDQSVVTKTLAEVPIENAVELKVQENRIKISIPMLADSSAVARHLALMVGRLYESSAVDIKRDRMRALGLGILNYESATREFPPSTRARKEDGTTGLSWRVYILPYIGEEELYNEFRLDEPWDSEHNLTLLPKMPRVFDAYGLPIDRRQDQLNPGYTTFVAPVGDNTVLGGSQATKIGQIRDGTSKTLLLVEVKPDLAVPWTSPEDYRFSTDDPAAGLAWTADGTTLGMFVDLHIQLLKRSQMSPEMFRRLVQMNDGLPVSFE